MKKLLAFFLLCSTVAFAGGVGVSGAAGEATIVGTIETTSAALEAAVATTTLSVDTLAAQQATEAIDIQAAQASTTLAVQNLDKMTGFAAAHLTVSASTATAELMPSLGTARKVYIYSDKDVNFGGSGIVTGTDAPFIPGGAPFVVFTFSSADPAFYFVGRSETAEVKIWPATIP